MITVDIFRNLAKRLGIGVGPVMRFVDIEFNITAAAYDSGDVVTLPIRIPNAVKDPGGVAYLVGMVLRDRDHQGVACYLEFHRDETAYGAVNAPVSITDGDLERCLGTIAIASTDYRDLITGYYVTKTMSSAGFPLPVQANPGSRDIFVSLCNSTGTPTYTARGVRATLIFQDSIKGS